MREIEREREKEREIPTDRDRDRRRERESFKRKEIARNRRKRLEYLLEGERFNGKNKLNDLQTKNLEKVLKND